MKRKIDLILTLLCGAFFLLIEFGCTRIPKSSTTYKTVPITVTGFIQDCKSGNSTTGTSTSDVNYTAKIYTYMQSGNSYLLVDTKTISSPSGSDKSTFTVQVQVANNVTNRILVTVDASECSKCNYSFGCNPYNNGSGYIVNAGKPYWQSDVYYPPSNLGTTLTIVPNVFPRNPNSTPDCSCKIKL